MRALAQAVVSSSVSVFDPGVSTCARSSPAAMRAMPASSPHSHVTARMDHHTQDTPAYSARVSSWPSPLMDLPHNASSGEPRLIRYAACAVTGPIPVSACA